MKLRDAIGVGLIMAFTTAIFVLFWRAIPASNEQLIVYMLGQLSGFVGSVIAFHYVMNKNSDAATENTGKAFDAITAAANSTPAAQDDKALREGDSVTLEKDRQP